LTGIIILLIDIVSLSPRGRPLATNSDKALQRAADLLLFKLLPVAAVQSTGPDPNKSVDYLPAPALPAQQNCRSNSAATAARLRASELQRPRASEQANAGEQLGTGGRSKEPFAKKGADTCKYGQILTVHMRY
jgi:hypothetical protein